MHVPALAAAAIALCGCASTTTDPMADYSGLAATMADSVAVRGTKAFDFFYVQEIDGKPVWNSFSETTGAKAGFSLTPVNVDRSVPARTATFTIVARTHYAAPAPGNALYAVTGRVRFTPVAGRSYQVRGSLGPDRSAVWVADKATGQVMDKKVEVESSPPSTVRSKPRQS